MIIVTKTLILYVILSSILIGCTAELLVIMWLEEKDTNVSINDEDVAIEDMIYAELCSIADNCITNQEDMELFELCADHIMYLVRIGLDGED